MSDSLWPHGLQQARPPCPSQTPGVYSNSCPLSRWCHPGISPSVVPFSSCPQSLPASGSFPTSQLQIETHVVTINKGCKNIQWGKTISSITGGKTEQTCKRMKLKYPITTCTKIKSKGIKDLSLGSETTKFLNENIGRTFDIIIAIFFVSAKGNKSKK